MISCVRENVVFSRGEGESDCRAPCVVPVPLVILVRAMIQPSVDQGYDLA